MLRPGHHKESLSAACWAVSPLRVQKRATKARFLAASCAEQWEAYWGHGTAIKQGHGVLVLGMLADLLSQDPSAIKERPSPQAGSCV